MKRSALPLILIAMIAAGAGEPPGALGAPESGTAAARAPGPRLMVTSDRGSFRIGEPVRLTVEVTVPAGVEVELPVSGTDLGVFELLSCEVSPPDSLPSGEVRHAAQLTVTAYAADSVTVPPLTALLRTAHGSATAIPSDSLTLGIESVLANADSADIRPLKRQIELPGGHPWWILWIAVAVLAVLGGVILWRRRRRRPVPLAVGRDPRPADVVALEALEALRRDRLAGAGKIKEHYIRLADIVRPYVERRYGIPALDLTTGEILGAMAAAVHETGGRGVDAGDNGEPPAAVTELKRLLEESDLVKFARFRPQAALAEGAIDRAADFVRATAVKIPISEAPPMSKATAGPSAIIPPAPGAPPSATSGVV